jgi:DNA replication initiation complex subunit (GINS family)
MLSQKQYEKLEALKRELEKAEGKAGVKEDSEDLGLTKAQSELLTDLRDSPYLRGGTKRFRPI